MNKKLDDVIEEESKPFMFWEQKALQHFRKPLSALSGKELTRLRELIKKPETEKIMVLKKHMENIPSKGD